MRIDKLGMILSGEGSGDGGDTCHRMFSVYLTASLLNILKLKDKTLETIKNLSGPFNTEDRLEVDSGVYIRHPDPTQWTSDPKNFSRDQMTPVICYYALESNLSSNKNDFSIVDRDREKLAQKRLLIACLKRGMFSQNIYPNGVDSRIEKATKKIPDFIGPDLWGIFARTWIKTWFAPIALPFILFGDLFLVFGALWKVFGPEIKDGTFKIYWPGPDKVDDMNLNNTLIATQYLFQTPLSWLARKIYKKFRRKNYGNFTLKEESAIMGAIAWYNKDDNPEITEFYRPLVERY